MSPLRMYGLSQSAARHIILMVAGVYILLLGVVEGARHLGLVDLITSRELVERVTTLGSLSVGAVIGVHLASRRHEG